MTTVDAHVHAHGLAVDVLKIDTEGYDGLVLLGANETLAQPSLKLVFFEYAVAPPWFERRDTSRGRSRRSSRTSLSATSLGSSHAQ